MELGVSTDTVIRRFKLLQKNDGIKPTLDLDILKLGYEVRVWFSISSNQ